LETAEEKENNMSPISTKIGPWTLTDNDPGFAYNPTLLTALNENATLVLLLDTEEDRFTLVCFILTTEGDSDEEMGRSVEFRVKDKDGLVRAITMVCEAYRCSPPVLGLVKRLWEQGHRGRG
jgi:hypothetical protein